ncbi:MAG: PepSY domain-containing protein [Hydrogenophaga sp.]|nr:PepSY domain-containing protein [Hydrogenophaga sp.]
MTSTHPRLPSWLARLTLAAVLSTALLPAMADNDHNRARAAVQSGQILPLKAVLERLERDHPGQVLEIELDEEKGRWVYEVRLLQADGKLVKLELDAATADVLRSRSRPNQR